MKNVDKRQTGTKQPHTGTKSGLQVSWFLKHGKIYPLSQNDYRQEKIIFELFSGALQENPVWAPGALT